MPNKSIWDSSLAKGIIVISALVTIVAFLLQELGKVDFWQLLVIPIYRLLVMPVPAYSIPLAFLVVLGGFLLILYVNSKLRPDQTHREANDPLAGAEYLDDAYPRFLAICCRNPRSPDELKRLLRDFSMREGRGYDFNYIVQRLEREGLIRFEAGKWLITQKAETYIAKYHGD